MLRMLRLMTGPQLDILPREMEPECETAIVMLRHPSYRSVVWAVQRGGICLVHTTEISVN